MSEETRWKISASVRATWSNPEMRQAQSERLKIVFQDPIKRAKPRHEYAVEERLRLRERARQMWRDGKFRPAFIGRSHSGETKAKLAASTSRLWKNETYREKVLANNPFRKRELSLSGENHPLYGKRHSEDSRRKMSEAAKRRLVNDPGRMKRMSDLARAKWRALGHRIYRTPTSIELSVARVLDLLNVQYEQQRVIGPYIVDIYIADRNLIIECDGDYWHTLPGAQERDRVRDQWLEGQGYHVCRLWEHDIDADPQTAVFQAISLIS